MMKKEKFSFKKYIFPAVASVVVFALMVLLIIVTRKPEDAEAASSVTIGGKTYSADGNHMIVLEVVPDESYDVLGSLVADNQGVIKWTQVVSNQPKEKDKFITYAQDYAINYLRSIDSTLGGKIAKAYFKNTLTNDLYSFGDFYQTTTAEKINYDLGNLQLVFYTVDSNGNPVELIKDSSTNKPIRDIFSYSIFDSTKMNGALEIKYVKASEVTIADIDSAAMVYFSIFKNNYILQMYKKMKSTTGVSIDNWTKGTYDLKADVALHLYMENITASKAVVYCSTEKNAITTNIGKMCMLIDAIDGDYFVRDFAYNYVGNTNRMYEGKRGWIDVSNDTLKLFIGQSTLYPEKTNYELSFGPTMFSNCNDGYAPKGEYNGGNGSYSYPRYNGTQDDVQQTLRKASLSMKNQNALVQGLESDIGNIDDYKNGTYRGTYYQDARKALGVEDDEEFRYSQAIRYILGDFDTSNISTIKVLEVEPAGYYRYTGTMEDQKNIRRWFSLSTETNSAGDKFVVPYNIVIDHCSTNALIAKNVDLAAEYDLIIMGAYGKDKFSSENSVTPFNTEILGNVFSKGSSWVSGRGSDVEGAKLNGNDITDKVYDKLYDYTLRGMPIVFDKSLYFGDTKVTEDDTNMYKLRMDDLITKILADKGTNGNLTYTDVSAQGEQKVSIRLKFIKKPGEVIGSTYTNYNGKMANPVVYSVDGLDGTVQTDSSDGNIKVTFSSSEALPSGNYRIKIYIDRNQDGIFADDVRSDKKELLYYDETNVRGSNDEYYGKLYSSSGTNKFETSVLLPAASRGYFAWKVEIVKVTGTDFASVDKVKYSAKSVKEGGFAIKGNETTVKVLQINNSTGNLDLTGTGDGSFNSYFNKASKMTGLNLAVTRINVNDVNSLADPSKEFSKYSMIVLGMSDSYGENATFNSAVISALQQYINEGNAVLFTHDTMSYTDSGKNTVKSYSNLTDFTKGFLPLIGMKNGVDTSFTDSLHFRLARISGSGYNYPYIHIHENKYEKVSTSRVTTSTISKLNDGQITEYPYAISNDVGVATTHAQYFALNLENHYANNAAASSPTIYNADGSMASQPVVWYTLKTGSGDDIGYYDYNGQDAMSNYYIYSYGNVTYSTAGHSGITGEAEKQLFVNTFTRSLLSGNNNPEVEYTDKGSKYDESTTDYKNYNKTEFDKLARTKLSFKFRIMDADLISNSDYISDAFMYIYNADSGRTDAMYDSSKDIYLGKINEATLADGTKTISLTGTSSSVIVGKEYTVENFWDVLTELNDTLTTKIDIANLKSRMKSGELKIGILATDNNDGKGYAILTIDCKTLFDLD